MAARHAVAIDEQRFALSRLIVQDHAMGESDLNAMLALKREYAPAIDLQWPQALRHQSARFDGTAGRADDHPTGPIR